MLYDMYYICEYILLHIENLAESIHGYFNMMSVTQFRYFIRGAVRDVSGV